METVNCSIHGDNIKAYVGGNGKTKFCSKCYIENRKQTAQKRKLQLITELGGKCYICGYNRNAATLHFHHLNPAEKNFALSARNKISHSKYELSLLEAKKCVLLCANCHSEFHTNFIDLSGKIIGNPMVLEHYTEKQSTTFKTCRSCGKKFNHPNSKTTTCKSCHDIQQRKVDRPPLRDLTQEISHSNKTEIAKKYGVSRTTINRWLKSGAEGNWTPILYADNVTHLPVCHDPIPFTRPNGCVSYRPRPATRCVSPFSLIKGGEWLHLGLRAPRPFVSPRRHRVI